MQKHTLARSCNPTIHNPPKKKLLTFSFANFKITRWTTGKQWGSLEKWDINHFCAPFSHFQICKRKAEEFLLWASVYQSTFTRKTIVRKHHVTIHTVTESSIFIHVQKTIPHEAGLKSHQGNAIFRAISFKILKGAEWKPKPKICGGSAKIKVCGVGVAPPPKKSDVKICGGGSQQNCSFRSPKDLKWNGHYDN